MKKYTIFDILLYPEIKAFESRVKENFANFERINTEPVIRTKYHNIERKNHLNIQQIGEKSDSLKIQFKSTGSQRFFPEYTQNT